MSIRGGSSVDERWMGVRSSTATGPLRWQHGGMSTPDRPDGTATLPPEPVGDDPMVFTCPRCRLEVTEQLYGPCSSCRTTLRAVIGVAAREVDEVDYEPKMNVTPNAVATKD
jgi:hypothetical protein